METKVAKEPIKDWDAYIAQLQKRLGHDNKFLGNIGDRAAKSPKRVVFAEGDNYKILKAAQIAQEEGICIPILLGDRSKIRKRIEEYSLDLHDAIIIDPRSKEEEERRLAYGELMFSKRQRKGFTLYESQKIMRERNYFGSMMVESGDGDALISGISRSYKEVIRPALQILGTSEEVNRVAGMYIIITKEGPLFFADTTVNQNPTAEELVEITLQVAKAVRSFKMQPKIAMLSYSNFGSSDGPDSEKVSKAVSILHRDHPNLIVDGEVQANFAMNQELMEEFFSFSALNGKKPNTLIFPNLAAGNIAYKLLQEMTQAEVVGPILLWMKKSFHVLQIGCSVREIVNMIKIAVLDAQVKTKSK
jgi:malate dehydrogenase (oxaloacetate-decarboxylating)(NADP+)